MTNPNDDAMGQPTKGESANGSTYIYSYGGLTKREYFAAMAMARLAAEHEGRNTHWEADLAYNAVRVADALIVELNKGTE